MQQFWTTATLDPSETSSEGAIRYFNTISISDVQLPGRNQAAALPSNLQSLNIYINNSIKDQGGLPAPLFPAKSLRVCYVHVSHLHQAEQFFWEHKTWWLFPTTQNNPPHLREEATSTLSAGDITVQVTKIKN